MQYHQSNKRAQMDVINILITVMQHGMENLPNIKLVIVMKTTPKMLFK